jgi:hypothetical protein
VITLAVDNGWRRKYIPGARSHIDIDVKRVPTVVTVLDVDVDDDEPTCAGRDTDVGVREPLPGILDFVEVGGPVVKTPGAGRLLFVR